MKRPSVLLVYVNYSSFVKADFELLSTFANVTKYQFRPGKGIFATGLELVREGIFLVFNGYKFDTIFSWFGDYHSLLPILYAKVFRKKSVVVIGGYDVSTLAEYSYGAFSHPIRAFFTRNTFKYAGICFPVAEALRLRLIIINPKVNAETLSTGVNPKQFTFTNYERPKRVLTISVTENYQRLMVKGLDRFRELALHLPDFEFVIIGATNSVRYCFEPVPANLILIPPQQFDSLEHYYQDASFYAQLSRSEGLPNALCEAMLCGCIPLGTNVGDIQVTIGDTGMTTDEWNPEKVAEFIRSGHNNYGLRDQARERIKMLYDNPKRAERFRQLVENQI
jgi:glycosyltransferase involved in cell wall biosynthesis